MVRVTHYLPSINLNVEISLPSFLQPALALFRHPRTRLPARLYTGANIRMPPISREDLLEEIARPVDAHDGTPYLCLQSDLDMVHQHPGRTHRLFVSHKQATREVVGCNNLRRTLSSYEQDAIRRLKHAVYNASRRPWGLDLIIKMFLDLDAVFFGGVLRGYVCVSWSARTSFFDAERSFGTTWSCSSPGHAVIYLNAEEIVLGPSPFPNMCRTMLHEMCVSVADHKCV